MKLGIVGLPNVGKSTLFNSLTKAGAESANYPFCTIDPNIGIVAVPDQRLKVLSLSLIHIFHIPIFFHCIQYFCICICIIPLYFYFLNRKVCKQKVYSQSDNYYKSNQKQEEMAFSWIIVCNQF